MHPEASTDWVVDRDSVNEILHLHGSAASDVERAGRIEFRDPGLRCENAVDGIAGHGCDLVGFKNPCRLRDILLNQRFSSRHRDPFKRDDFGGLESEV